MLARTSQPSPSGETLEELVSQIADSDSFRMAPVMRTLLLYLWKHQGESISEYAIAVDALGRPADFDPKTDSTVRVQIARLRAKLKSFYESAGADFPLQLSIPLGRHELVYAYSVTPDPPPPVARVPRRYTAAVVTAAAVLLGLSLLLFLENRALRASFQPQPQLPAFWESFLAGGAPALIVVPSPQYFFWRDRRVYVRDLAISSFEQWPSSAVLKDLAANWGPPEFAQTYVGAMEMSAGVRLLQFLDKQQIEAQLIESRKFSVESFSRENTVFLGMPRTTAGYLDRFIAKTNFHLASVDPDVVRSRRPEPGETAEFAEKTYSADRKVYPGIIMLLPERPEGTRSVIILGRNLTGATSMLLTIEGQNALDGELERNGRPDAWEMVVEAEFFRDTLLKVRPAAFRPISSGFWNEVK